MSLFKVSFSLYLICYPFFLILDLFYVSVHVSTTLTTLSCKTEAKVNVFCLLKMYQGVGPREKSTCQSMAFYCVDNIDKKHESVVLWLPFRCSCRDPSFSLTSNPILSRICKAHSNLAHYLVFLHTFLTFFKQVSLCLLQVICCDWEIYL